MKMRRTTQGWQNKLERNYRRMTKTDLFLWKKGETPLSYRSTFFGTYVMVRRACVIVNSNLEDYGRSKQIYCCISALLIQKTTTSKNLCCENTEETMTTTSIEPN